MRTTEQHHAGDALLRDAMGLHGAVSHGQHHLYAIAHDTLRWNVILQGSRERLRWRSGRPQWLLLTALKKQLSKVSGTGGSVEGAAASKALSRAS